MIVLNDTTHVIVQGIHTFTKNAQGESVAQVNKLRTVRILPGVNDIPDADWAECKKVASIQHRIDEGELREKGDMPFSKRTLADAKKLVKDTVDPALLAKWKREDLREDVQKAIAAQLSKATLSDEEKKALREQ